jgi:hypothetical protein
MRPSPAAAVVLVVLLLPLLVAQAGEGQNHVVGARVALLQEVRDHGLLHYGGGLSVERAFFSHRLELELVALGLPTGHGLLLPVELLAKIPFHPTPWLQPYIGAGPAMALNFDARGTEVHFGGACVLGSYFWLGGGFGLMLELNYELFYDHGAASELGTSAGVVWAF